MAWLNAGMFGVLLPGLYVLNTTRVPGTVLVGALSAVLSTLMVAGNQFGSDGQAWWSHAVVPDNPRADLAGKNYALALIALPLAALVAVGLAAVTGGWTYVPATVALAACGIAVALGVGNVTSVVAPFPLTTSSGNVWGAPAGSGCAMGLVSLVGMGVAGLLVGPVVVAVVLTRNLAPFPLVVVGATIYGALVWRMGLGMAAGRIEGRYPELLDRLTPRV